MPPVRKHGSLALFRAACLFGSALAACRTDSMRSPASSAERTFAEDVEFLRAHRETLVLTAPDGRGQIAVVPEFQGRVMTSSARGATGRSYGFIKHELVASDVLAKGINPYGGEDRFWIGPEGGPFSVFFAPGVPEQSLAHWQTPALIDTQPFPVVERSESAVSFARTARLTNFSGTVFDLRIDRTVEVLDARQVMAELGLDPRELEVVAYESRNTLTNTGGTAWTRATGLLSIWILGMFKPSPRTTVVLPLAVEPGQDLDELVRAGLVRDAYFGKVPAERLRLLCGAGGAALLFRADGELRSKIGVAPAAARPIAASWDAGRGVLTLVTFTLPADARDYVNSLWELPQAEPFRGDVLNSYNDGPSAPGAAPFGPFYELESSSPAAELAAGEALSHRHRTLHLEGSRAALERVARAVLGLSLSEIESAL